MANAEKLLPGSIDIPTQIAWMREEMLYGHGKTGGFREKLRRLQVEAGDNQSVMSFMGSYWKRFTTYALAVETQPEQTSADQALIYIGKLASGLTDKVGLGLMLKNPGHPEDEYIMHALVKVDEEITQHSNPSTWQALFLPDGIDGVLSNEFVDTDIGRDVLQLHALGKIGLSIREDQNSQVDLLINRAAMASTHTMHLWSAYTQHVYGLGLDSTMPHPGLPSGTIQPWQRMVGSSEQPL